MSCLERVQSLRALMAEQNLHAFIVPSEDAHMSEYVAACDERRAFISGFTGSAGTALITTDKALCWTDSRYFLQAKLQLDPKVFKMMRMHEDPSLEDWIAANFKKGDRIGIDGKTFSVAGMKRLKTALNEAVCEAEIVPLPIEVPNLVDQVWGSARPAIPASKVVVHDVKYAGVSAAAKLRGVRRAMSDRGATLLVVSALDEIAWLLNLRGSDVDYNPVFWAYVVITDDFAELFINSTRFADGVAEHLEKTGVTVYDYDKILKELKGRMWTEDDTVWIDQNTCNYAIMNVLEKVEPKLQILKKQGPVVLAKAKKSDTELRGVRNSHTRDGVALVKFLCWLENEVKNLGHEPTEVEASDMLDGLRSKQDLFVSLSFPTISGCASNGAIVHYRADPANCRKIRKGDMYLVDSGAQYKDGTTDVTRTVHLGEPSAWEKECFTRVLQGHIAIDRAVFPRGTNGHVLDAFARASLWKIGLDYKHGTGHGVGSHLNVHEGPHVISYKTQALDTALEPGFLTSNEPGYYEEGAFGIRIENVCIVVKKNVKGGPGGPEKPYYGMERVTMAPIQRNLIDLSLLGKEEREWVDQYHEEVYEKLSPYLKSDETTLAWLKENTAALA